MKRITWVPGAVGTGVNITIPTDAPDIDVVVDAEVWRLTSALVVNADTSGTTENAEIAGGLLGVGAGGHLNGGNPVVNTTPTKVNTRTIKLSSTTVLGDLLTLWYREVGERVAVS